MDYRIVLPDGSIRHAHSVGHPVSNASGDLVEYVGTTMDVTEHKSAEEALRASEQVARGQVEALAQNLDILATAAASKNLIGQMLSTIGRFLKAQSVVLWLLDEAQILRRVIRSIRLLRMPYRGKRIRCFRKLFLPERRSFART
jgi:hypothetical protein